MPYTMLQKSLPLDSTKAARPYTRVSSDAQNKILKNKGKKRIKKTMTRKEELDHIIAAKAGSRFSMAQLVKKYERFYHKMAKKYVFTTSTHSEDDLVQEACIGLIKAVQTYDINKRASFFTWVYYHVRGAITKVTRSDLKKPAYSISLEDSLRAYNVEDPTQTKNPRDELPLQVLLNVCGSKNNLDYKLSFDRFGLGNKPKLSIKQCSEKYNMPYAKMSNRLKDIEHRIRKSLMKSGYSDSNY